MSEHQSAEVDRREFLRTSLAMAATAGTVSMGIVAQGNSTVSALTTQKEADAFLAEYAQGWLPLETAAQEAAWAGVTDVTEAHTAAQVAAMQKVNEFVGSKRVIDTVARLLAHKEQLDDLTIRQLEKARLRAAEAPATVPEVVKARTEGEAKQGAAQDGFTYILKQAEKPEVHPSANDIDRVLVGSRNLDERRTYWEVSKTIGGPLREGILRLRDLRNQVARAMGFDNFFALQVADYGMTVPELMALSETLVAEIKPLYAQLHTWAKHTLAKRFNTEIPTGMIPAHWLPNRWGQNWPGGRGGYGYPVPG